MKHRWHWTLNEDNPEGGVSFTQYGRQVDVPGVSFLMMPKH